MSISKSLALAILVRPHGSKNSTRNNIDKIHIEGIVHTNPSIISNLFNDYYINLVDNEIIPKVTHNSMPLPDTSLKQSGKFMCEPVNEAELLKIIMAFENKFSTGYDGVPIIVIKHAKDYLVKPLVHLINSSFISGIFPEKLKIAKIRPMHKKGCITDISNYRPLALLPVISKIYEKVMHNRLVRYFDGKKLFDSEQHGFRHGHSVTTAAADYIDSIINSIDQGEKVAGVLMDLHKAFDSVSPLILLDILSDLGIRGPVLKWLCSYLIDRQQFVELFTVNNHNVVSSKSKLKTVKYGVPQGSILGPILFICYLRGLPRVILNYTFKNICMFADDINLLIKGKSPFDLETSAIANLAKILHFLADHNILVNKSKTKVMQFFTKANNNIIPLHIHLDGTKIEEVSETKFLGLVVDNNLSWDQHVDYVAKKVSSGLFALYKLAKFCTVDTLRLVYFAHIHSNISFGLSIYGATSKKNLDRLLILQKRAIRTMLQLPSQSSVKEEFSNLNIMTVYSCYIYQCILYAKQNCKSTLLLGNNHSYETRNRNNFMIPSHKLKFFEKKTSYVGIKCINRLPSVFKNVTNYDKFTNMLKSYMLSKPLYSVEEFFEQM
uniref:Reverse transcriptase domain-containing protein n=1 Tax=Graphocephala atropunctata TaxID=36148 RepID=A0A1B6LTV8_9HEMI